MNTDLFLCDFIINLMFYRIEYCKFNLNFQYVRYIYTQIESANSSSIVRTSMKFVKNVVRLIGVYVSVCVESVSFLIISIENLSIR